MIRTLSARRITLTLPAAARILIALSFGLALFVGGAVGVEIAFGWAITNLEVRTIVVLMLTNLEVPLETLSMCVVIYAMLDYLDTCCEFAIHIGRQPVRTSDVQPQGERHRISGEFIAATN